jgi:hypothetical protein
MRNPSAKYVRRLYVFVSNSYVFPGSLRIRTELEAVRMRTGNPSVRIARSGDRYVSTHYEKRKETIRIRKQQSRSPRQPTYTRQSRTKG